jgi:hypothetical protein
LDYTNGIDGCKGVFSLINLFPGAIYLKLTALCDTLAFGFFGLVLVPRECRCCKQN